MKLSWYRAQTTSNPWGAGIDFVSAIIAGVIVGVILEKAFSCIAPWGVVGGIFLGFAAGVRSVYRHAGVNPRGKGPLFDAKNDQKEEARSQEEDAHVHRLKH